MQLIEGLALLLIVFGTQVLLAYLISKKCDLSEPEAFAAKYDKDISDEIISTFE